MKTKNKILLILGILLLFIFLYQANATYAKYVKANSPTLVADYEKWNIKVNGDDISSGKEVSNVTSKIVVEKDNVDNKFFSDDVLAPGRYGYIDIDINFKDVTVPFTYEINATNTSNNENIIEYIRLIDHKETDEEITEYMTPVKTSLMDIDNPFSEVINPLDIEVPSGSEVTTSEPAVSEPIESEPTTSGEGAESDIISPYVRKIRVYFIWRKAQDVAGSNYNDNVINGEGEFEYRINIKFNQVLNYDKPEEPVEKDPLLIDGRQSIDDKDNDSYISVGDIIKFNENEKFYVFEIVNDNQGPLVRMLALYNLNVGKNTVAGEIGMQNPLCTDNSSFFNKPCTVAFYYGNTDYGSEDRPILPGSHHLAYWDVSRGSPNYVYSQQSELFKYVDEYVKKLNELGYVNINGSVISKEDLQKICINPDGISCNTKEYLPKTTFWTGSAFDNSSIIYFNSNGYFLTKLFYNDISVGVRPTIRILAKNIK